LIERLIERRPAECRPHIKVEPAIEKFYRCLHKQGVQLPTERAEASGAGSTPTRRDLGAVPVALHRNEAHRD
jgi:hypothetical protein